MNGENRLLIVFGQVDEKYIEEAAPAKKKRASRPKWLIAAVLAALLLVGFACMPLIIEMLSGRTIVWDDNHLFTSGTVGDIAEVRDGRVYFTLDNSDITEYCSEDTYYRYDYTDEQGIHHVFLVGGELDSIGWTEILFFDNGRRLSHSSLQTENGDDPAWYVTGNADANEDYGYVPPDSNKNYHEEFEIPVFKD